ncbi:hypothetical protein [Caulobacter endophyticus]|uniref:Uncharacterized protein n=1 Tax=Caulobacter endophyticus TaxID=2172652 RepID=A0A2T9JUK2_9CAUL|nr:hypothetical protein [Caulobacter endophyticus]PVM87366.1 hypothetical protein DDF67_13980 [Caulobacter endophyticus]
MTDRTCEELAELWRAVFGEAPPIITDRELTVEVLVRCLPDAEPYAPQAPATAKLEQKAS